MVESVNPRLDKTWKWTETKERPMVHYTRKGDAVYAICLAWPGKVLKLEIPKTTPQTQVQMLGHSKPLNWRAAEKGLVIDVPEMSVSEIPCRNAWTFMLTGLKATGSPR
jgi:alpha-L-fucosidase